MKRTQKTVAYIDGANLYNGVQSLGWKLDYRFFRRWLEQKYGVTSAYLFIGMLPANLGLYTHLQEQGYILVYKEVTYDGAGKPKGNCDADLVVKAVSDYYEQRCDNFILVSNDGDYSSLVKFLKEKAVFGSIVSPSDTASLLLRKLNVPIMYLDSVREKLSLRKKNEKAPGAGEPAQGSSSS